MSDQKIIPGHVGYAPDYKSAKPDADLTSKAYVLTPTETMGHARRSRASGIAATRGRATTRAVTPSQRRTDVSDWADERATALARTAPDACEGDPCGQCQALATSIAAELRAAYERGARAAAAPFTAHGGFAWRCLDHGGEEADEIARRILALLDKEGGGDGSSR